MQAALLSVFRELVCGRAPWPLFLWGQPGRGKTCAALALADHVLRAEYRTCTELNQRMQESYKRDGIPFPWDSLSRKRCDLLVVDEVGLRTPSEAAYEVLHGVLDRRVSSGLICVSNLSLDAIGKVYDARTVSRLGAGVVFELKGDDRRTD